MTALRTLAVICGLLILTVGAGLADTLRIQPSEVREIASEEDAILFEADFVVDGMREVANRTVLGVFLDWRLSDLDGNRGPVLSVSIARPVEQGEGNHSVDLILNDTIDIVPIGAFRIEKTGGFVRLDVSKVEWTRDNGARLTFVVLARGVKVPETRRQLGNVSLVIRYGFIPDSIRGLLN